MSDFKTEITNFRKRVWNGARFVPQILFNARFPNIMLLLAGAIWFAVRGQWLENTRFCGILMCVRLTTRDGIGLMGVGRLQAAHCSF
jgi:hypothetical protein